MIVELLLVLPLYAMLVAAVYRFRRIIKAMDEFSEIFNEVDTPASAEEQASIACGSAMSKRQFLEKLLKEGKKLPGKWTIKKLEKASDDVIDRLYDEYQQAEVKEKAENTGKAMSKHVVHLYSNSISKILKIDSVDQLRKDIEEDPVIRDSMAGIGALMVGTFGRFLAPVLVAAHTANHTQGFVSENKDETSEIACGSARSS